MGGHGVRVVVRLRPPRQEADAAAADSSKTITMTDDRTTVLRCVLQFEMNIHLAQLLLSFQASATSRQGG